MQVATRSPNAAPPPATAEARASQTDPKTKTESSRPPPPPSSAGPAATVDISSQAKAALRAAGVSASDAAKVNLKDAGAVQSAVKHAKAARLAGSGHSSAVAAYAAVAAKGNA